MHFPMTWHIRQLLPADNRLEHNVSAFVIAALGSSGIGAVSAHADWAFTQWGMTEAQVIRAAEESIRGTAAQPERIPRERQTKMEEFVAPLGFRCTLEIKSYEVLSWNWRVEFCFDTDAKSLGVSMEHLFKGAFGLPQLIDAVHRSLGHPLTRQPVCK